MTNIKHQEKSKIQISRLIFWLGVSLLVVFLLTNVVFSQKISPLFVGVVNENESTAVSFLKKIKTLPVFLTTLKLSESVFNKDLKNEVFSEDVQRKAEIKKYEQLLVKNPSSRDILYRLYQLYLVDNNQRMAAEYFKRARAIDPLIK